MKKFITSIFLISFAVYYSLSASLISDPHVLEELNKQFIKQSELTGTKSIEYANVSDLISDQDEQYAFRYIYAYSPLSDLADYSADFLATNARMAVKAVRNATWGKDIPENIFLHFVLPPRINNENLDSFRIIMYDSLKARITGMDLHKAALEINHWCHEHVTYRGSDSRTSSPLSTIRTYFGRCGEESTLLVAALRTVAIPARQVYTPRWAHCDDNHAWVEAWVNGRWCFMGACEPSPELNMGWFSVAATRTMLVNTRAFGAYFGTDEDIIYNGDRFAELNVLSNYTTPKEVKIIVKNEKGKILPKADVAILLYNYAEFYPLAHLFTDSNGVATFKTGYGDLLVSGSKDGLFTMSKLDAMAKEITLVVKKNPKFSHQEFELVPPTGINKITITTQKSKQNEIRLLAEDSIRNRYMATFYDTLKAVALFNELKLKDSSFINLIIHSCGNYAEIIKFIRETPDSLKQMAIDLLNVISEKDLHDTRAGILKNHLDGAMKYYDKFTDKDIWKNNVLSGRIYNEMMKDWRSIGDSVLLFFHDIDISGFNKLDGEKQIKLIVAGIYSMIKIDSIANAHSRAPLTPLGVFKLQCADYLSRDIFFVAVCRSLGIPARINEQTTIPQYYVNNQWADAVFEVTNKENQEYGYVHFVNKSDFEPKYYSNFTIGRMLLPKFATIEFEDIIPISQMKENLQVPAGKYILTTGNRDTDGKVFVSVDFFNVAKNKTTDVDVKVRNLPKTADVWATINLSDFEVTNVEKTLSMNLKELTGGDEEKPFVLAVIEPDKEPTKHVMADFIANSKRFESWNGNIIFVIPEGKINSGFSPASFSGLPSNSSFAVDKNNSVLSEIEKLRKVNNLMSDLPVVIFGNKKSELLYFSQGYRIGTINDLEKLIFDKAK